MQEVIIKIYHMFTWKKWQNSDLIQVGGWNELFDLKYPCSTTDNYTYILNEKEIIVPEVCRYPPDNWNHILRDLDDPNFPWPGVVFGMIIGSIWYWCADQVIVQRCLSARDLSNGKLGCVGAAFCKILPVFLMVIPGMISRALWPNDIACKTPEECLKACDSEVGCTNVAYPLLVMRILPNGLKVCNILNDLSWLQIWQFLLPTFFFVSM